MHNSSIDNALTTNVSCSELALKESDKSEKSVLLTSNITLAAFPTDTITGKIIHIFAPILDRLLGINKLKSIYLKQKLSGLNKQEFCQRLLTGLGVTVLDGEKLTAKIPKTGRCIVVCNHPYGMVEGIIIAQLLNAYRSDTKVMANIALKTFKEINDYFIFANPLKPNAPVNATAIKQCYQHVENEGLLVIFPAGRVYYRFRLAMLAHEMFKLQGHKITLSTHNLITPKQLHTFDTTEKKNAFVCKNPRYRTLYGTVSLSKLYDPRSVAIMEKAMVNKTEGVCAKNKFTGKLHPEVNQFITQERLGLKALSTMVMALEQDGKDIPVLLKQYHKLGANFHCITIDNNFNQTPGLLLSVHLPIAPEKLLKLYLGDNKADYLAFRE